MEKVAEIVDLLQGSSHVDCYVSTEVSEISEYLEERGYLDDGFDDSLAALRDPAGCTTALVQPKTGLRLGVVDMRLDDALGWRKDLGFTPMALLRVYSNGSTGVEGEIGRIVSLLQSERQNVAVLNDSHSRSKVYLSEYY